MKRVLIVDSTDYQNTLQKIFSENGYDTAISETAFDAITELHSDNYDLVVSAIDLPGDNSFELYYYLNLNYPSLPIIMTTPNDIDNYFEEVYKEGIGNILKTPVNEREILSLAEKLLSGEDMIFGLKNYIPGIERIKKIRINSSKQIQKAISVLAEHIDMWEFQISNKNMLNLLLNEIIINAVYHAHGHTQEKLDRVPVTLAEGEFVDISFTHNSSSLGISIRDYTGVLSKKRILQCMYKVINQQKIIEKAVETGEDVSAIISDTGRGIELIRHLTNEFYFIIQKNVGTEVILIFNKKFDFDSENKASIKIIEKI